MSRDFITRALDGILLDLRVSPSTKRTSIEGPYGGSAIRLRVTAPPVDRKAKFEVESSLAKLLEVVPLNNSEQAGIREILPAYPR